MNRKDFARLVNANRAVLLKHYSYLSTVSASEAMKALTAHAVSTWYINTRPSPPGETLKEWVMNKNPPQWACRAAFDLLLVEGWKPQTNTEKAIAARYLVLNQHIISNEWRQHLGQWLTIANQADAEN
ncbi:hypothetical protein DEB41_17630 (plasmid) [Vibrio anguillarum]|uniref:Uncharacterized protein n=2 Tax=Vibrio anguillarum TaxID=55601 RepID=A0A3M7LJD2_VIBAN|nr:hypothetical protein [Vibrio anguillarum]AAR12546.1 hypothetical protein [Vibrio anguillarum 775]AGU59981.1 hypothetical protein N175_19475 [Vibrio anguillarum M3]ATA51786.1 hypothetical protein CLI14_19190 [Vibrio anguillarum]AVT65643.1 hypothetical protein B5S57_00080 [Vibrio anguillarum]AXN09321.1 hypothetical protein DEA53_17835 [Vibrio anguillarum]